MYAVQRRRGPTVFGCAGIVVVTLLVVFLVVGWFRNWYDVSGREDAQQAEFGVQIHKEELERDFGKLREESERVAESAQVAAELETLEGTVSDVSATQMTVRVGDTDHAVAVDEVTQFYVGDEEADLQNIQTGDPVRVTYQETDAQKRASRVTVQRD